MRTNVQFLPCTSLKLNCDVFRLLREFYMKIWKFKCAGPFFCGSHSLSWTKKEISLFLYHIRAKTRDLVSRNGLCIVDKPTPNKEPNTKRATCLRPEFYGIFSVYHTLLLLLIEIVMNGKLVRLMCCRSNVRLYSSVRVLMQEMCGKLNVKLFPRRWRRLVFR